MAVVTAGRRAKTRSIDVVAVQCRKDNVDEVNDWLKANTPSHDRPCWNFTGGTTGWLNFWRGGHTLGTHQTKQVWVGSWIVADPDFGLLFISEAVMERRYR